MSAKTAKLTIKYENGATVYATLDPAKAHTTLQAMKAGSVTKPLVDFNGIVTKLRIKEPASVTE
jgi:hypothetical protein